MNKLIKLILLPSIILMMSCKNEDLVQKASNEYLQEINDWDNRREANLRKETGWLNLVGLHWLNEGENTFGSDKSNDIVFPENKADAFLGKIIKSDSVITIVVNDGVSITNDGHLVTKMEMKADITGERTILNHNSLRWFIIKRGDRYGIRLRDLEAELVKNFEGIDRFPINEDWKITAKYEKFDTPQKIMIPTILGTIEEDVTPGKLNFTVSGKEYSLQPTTAGSGFFIVFADLTSGEESYGAGRFLYAEGPDSNNNVILDFNKSYNPPCAFTKYATCPLPADENKIRVRITAGEKNYGHGH